MPWVSRSIGRALGNIDCIIKRAQQAILRTSQNALLNRQWGSGRSFLACYTNCITGEHWLKCSVLWAEGQCGNDRSALTRNRSREPDARDGLTEASINTESFERTVRQYLKSHRRAIWVAFLLPTFWILNPLAVRHCVQIVLRLIANFFDLLFWFVC